MIFFKGDICICKFNGENKIIVVKKYQLDEDDDYGWITFNKKGIEYSCSAYNVELLWRPLINKIRLIVLLNKDKKKLESVDIDKQLSSALDRVKDAEAVIRAYQSEDVINAHNINALYVRKYDPVKE